ncbi:MAG TPA: hypothetical protein VN865_11060 [Candidatus Acidoferrales bacterium]|nr:hypothetical protein [Candidatus Acidoferrales bacterium]
MSVDVPFATRRGELLERAIAIFSADVRFPAGWLEGSLADGSADAYSDIDLHLCVVESAWDEVWNGRRREIERVAPILASLEIMGVFGVGCLIEGPVKLDVFFEKESGLGARPRVAVKQLWGALEIYECLKIGDDLGDAAIKQALQFNVMGLLQGATWPVRILARGQINTFLFNEILLVETAIVPLMLLETDRRAFHRNMFTRAKLLPPAQRDECARLVDRIETSVRANDRVAMRDLHVEIFRKICNLAGAAFEKYGLKFPPRVEAEMVEFYQREWPT